MNRFRKVVAISIVCILLSSPLLAQLPEETLQADVIVAQNESIAIGEVSDKNTSYTREQGRADGEMDAKGDPLWFLGGFACGCIGVGAAALINPGPKPMVIAEMSRQKGVDYTNSYVAAYQSKAKRKNVAYSVGGWAAYMVVYFAFIYPNQKSTTDDNNN